MKSNCYSPSTTLEQGELLASPFRNAQKSAKAHSTNTETKAMVKRFSPNKHQCIGVIPFGVTEETLDPSIQKQRSNEINSYHSGKEIARWLIKKSEYNKARTD
ncbi:MULTISPECIES: hypothetical protein [unclassified Lysinibacillus]|uniref:hypothetical protein n=1 Tax=unclassified Lysinibacillus TaxID=2636778 RepID=UPI00255691DC|nr:MULTISPECIES: hypothetical protein [unclassified Lysinibacillus]MDM5248538.1 hypothetical protein [Lysinibacillus sp. G4S2]